MGRGGDTTAQAQVVQAVVQQRVDPAILQLWTDVGETLNRNQTGETSFVFFLLVWRI
jgi:formate hydrogenlyase subunit 4